LLFHCLAPVRFVLVWFNYTWLPVTVKHYLRLIAHLTYAPEPVICRGQAKRQLPTGIIDALRDLSG
jgi:hypothetical protein